MDERGFAVSGDRFQISEGSMSDAEVMFISPLKTLVQEELSGYFFNLQRFDLDFSKLLTRVSGLGGGWTTREGLNVFVLLIFFGIQKLLRKGVPQRARRLHNIFGLCENSIPFGRKPIELKVNNIEVDELFILGAILGLVQGDEDRFKKFANHLAGEITGRDNKKLWGLLCLWTIADLHGINSEAEEYEKKFENISSHSDDLEVLTRIYLILRENLHRAEPFASE